MNRWVTPRNYDVRNRIVSKLLPPSHFTPPSNAISTPEATAPPYSQEKIQVPSTSLLLEAAATFTTPTVTIHTPISTLETISTSSTGTTPTSRLTTAFQSLFDHGSTVLSPPASNLGPSATRICANFTCVSDTKKYSFHGEVTQHYTCDRN
ncbi:hypothetical protein CHS0354_016910 [Potamilus streckersoni]|uniref:Uncharacterized protein n=1 Tax=Potamilus streckersoni TaxID=2493646 RepID=A0AAE0VRL2_9BIVA|nr:hypothetical protein CHS0354_016910 [Potamilus streckersoni]